MSARLQKEVRLLAPAWAAALLLTTLPLDWVRLLGFSEYIQPGLLPAAGFVVALLLLAVVPFGREFGHQTFQLFLSQPCSRARLWRDKVFILWLAAGSIWLAFWIGFSWSHGFSWWIGAMTLAAGAGLVSTGLWTSLFFRQVVPALCFSVLVPIVITPVIRYALAPEPPVIVPVLVLVLLTAYAVASWTFARRLFLRSEDFQRGEFDFALSLRRETVIVMSKGEPRGPVLSLFAKELRLHQINFLSAGVIFAGLGAVALVVSLGENQEAVETVRIALLLAALFMPIMVGAVAIAEERKLGVLEVQHSLPVSRGLQFLVKLVTVYGVSLTLGLLVPFLLLLGLSVTFGSPFEHLDLRAMVSYLLLATAIAFYSSSLARNTVTALIFATASVLVGVFFLEAVVYNRHWAVSVGIGLEWWPLLARVGLPVIGVALLFFALGAFRNPLVGSGKNARRCLGTIVAVVVLLAGIFPRPWEFVWTAPRVGPPEPSLASGAELHMFGFTVFIRLLDGRLWMSDGTASSNHILYPHHGRFMEGSDWRALVSNREQLVGIREDGSLWRIARWHLYERRTEAEMELMDPGPWKSVAGGGNHMIAAREDGSLWGWGRNNASQLSDDLPNSNYIAPARIGAESDWVSVFAGDRMSVGVKGDGTVWRWGEIPTGGKRRVVGHPELWRSFPEGDIVDFSARRGATAGAVVLTDGSLWRWFYSDGPERVDGRMDWQSAAVDDLSFRLIALREDGSLWGANMRYSGTPWKFPVPKVRLGRRSEWVAVARQSNGSAALAADGSVWVWDKPVYSNDETSPLLAPSIRPRPYVDLLREWMKEAQ